MTNFATRPYLDDAQRTLDDEQRERTAYLNKPFSGNPPELTAPTRCRVLRPFYVGGERVEVGTIVTLARHDAISLGAIGKVVLVP